MGKILKIIIFAVVLVTIIVIGDLTPFTVQIYTITQGMATPLRILLRLVANMFSYTYLNRVLLFYLTLYLVTTLLHFIFDNK